MKVKQQTESDIYEYDRFGNITINDLELSIRAVNALQAYGRHKTLADLERASDLDLLAIPNLGRKAIKEIRQIQKNVRSSTITLREELFHWVSQHETLVLALIKGEAVITPKIVQKESHNEH